MYAIKLFDRCTRTPYCVRADSCVGVPAMHVEDYFMRSMRFSVFITVPLLSVCTCRCVCRWLCLKTAQYFGLQIRSYVFMFAGALLRTRACRYAVQYLCLQVLTKVFMPADTLLRSFVCRCNFQVFVPV